MASLVLGGIGAAVGSMFGMPSLGFSIGSSIGSALFAPDMPTQYGPRLTDLKVVSSNYGEMIPLIWGNVRIAGKLVWSTPRQEKRHKSSGGGKGGPSAPSTVTYTYKQSMAYLLCEGPIVGVARIWINGKLVYNVSAAADAKTRIASVSGAKGIQIYLGTETQTASSIIQAYETVALTPAMRGYAYVVFDELDVTQLPTAFNVEFEVVSSGTYADSTTLLALRPGDSTLQWTCAVNSITSPNKVRGIYGEWDAWYDPADDQAYVYDTYPDGKVIKVAHIPLLDCSPVASQQMASGNSDVVSTIMDADAGFAGDEWQFVYLSDSSVSTGAYFGTASPWIKRIFKFVGGTIIASTPVYYYSHEDGLLLMGCPQFYADIFALTGDGGNALFAETSRPVITVPASYLVKGIDCTDDYIYVAYADGTTKRVRKYNRSDYSYVGEIYSAATGAEYALKVVSDTEIYIQYLTHVYEISTGSIAKTFDIGVSLWQDSAQRTTFNVFEDVIILAGAVSGSPWQVGIWTIQKALTASAATLDDVVSDISIRAGLAAGDIDVTDLTDDVDGYCISRVGSARSGIEPLMQAYYFDAVEIDAKVVFPKRGKASLVTIPEADLAAHADGSDMPDQLMSTRSQELELPCQINVTYLDKDAAYQIGSQYSRRLTTSSKQVVDVQLPLALSATKAKQIADVLLYDAWNSRNTYQIAVGNKYSQYTPTDVVSWVKDSVTYTGRLVQKNEAGGVISLDATAENIAVYTQTATAAPQEAPNDSVVLPSDTILKLMDIPLLRDQDEGIGFYGAASGHDSDWPGAVLMKSADGESFVSYGDAFLNPAVIGYANGVLGTFTGGNIFDETNTVSVTLYDGTLAGDSEINVLNGANAMLIGDEILQFKNATLTGTLTYTLSGLLRGRRGTEWAMSTHAVLDRVVLLELDTARIFVAPSAERNLARYYKAVTFGQQITEADPVSFTNTGVALKPYAPVQLGGGRNAALDVILNWIRRTRISGGWGDYSDVPLGEASEAYVVEIYSSNTYVTLKRTISGISSATTTYTAAQQTTDFGSTQSTVYFIVYQVSATVGNGYGARGQI